MSTAWGDSWGSSWGDAWDVVQPPPPPVPVVTTSSSGVAMRNQVRDGRPRQPDEPFYEYRAPLRVALSRLRLPALEARVAIDVEVSVSVSIEARLPALSASAPLKVDVEEMGQIFEVLAAIEAASK